ncbi:unnamed protein product [Durusdinium trenchii]|uniref:Uncharacterized protein n=1 Tax=Durusdinium trenchii TaxID=1381693 RepID=A0ABP0JH81_9DINO
MEDSRPGKVRKTAQGLGLLKAHSFKSMEEWKKKVLAESWATYTSRSDAWMQKQWQRVQWALKHPDVGRFQQESTIPAKKTWWAYQPKETADKFELWLKTHGLPLVPNEETNTIPPTQELSHAKMALMDNIDLDDDHQSVSQEKQDVPQELQARQLQETQIDEVEDSRVLSEAETCVLAVKRHHCFNAYLEECLRGRAHIAFEWRQDSPHENPARNVKDFNKYLGRNKEPLLDIKVLLREDESHRFQLDGMSEYIFPDLLQRARAHPLFDMFMEDVYSKHDEQRYMIEAWTFGSWAHLDFELFNRFLEKNKQQPLDLSSAWPPVLAGWSFGLSSGELQDLDEERFELALDKAKAHPCFQEFWSKECEENPDRAEFEFGSEEGDPSCDLDAFVLFLREKVKMADADTSTLQQAAKDAEAQVVADIETTACVKNGWPSIFNRLQFCESHLQTPENSRRKEKRAGAMPLPFSFKNKKRRSNNLQAPEVLINLLQPVDFEMSVRDPLLPACQASASSRDAMETVEPVAPARSDGPAEEEETQGGIDLSKGLVIFSKGGIRHTAYDI